LGLLLWLPGPDIWDGGKVTSDESADRIVDGLVADGLIADADRARARAVVVTGLAAPVSGAGLPKLVEVIAYLGAALVLAAGALFLAETWNDLGETGQVGALALVAVLLAAAGLVARPGPTPAHARTRLAGTLLTGAAVIAGCAVGLAVEYVGREPDQVWDDVYWPAAIGASVTLLLAVVGYRLACTAVGLLGILGGAFVIVTTVAPTWDGDEALYVGSSLAALAVVWLVVTELGAFAQQSIARSLGLVLVLFGSQLVSLASRHEWVGYALMVLVVVASVVLYLSRLDWLYLAAAVIGITLVVPEAVSDWTEGSLGVIGGVLVTGVTLLVASFTGYRLRAEATD